jgi:hypothetical protein
MGTGSLVRINVDPPQAIFEADAGPQAAGGALSGIASALAAPASSSPTNRLQRLPPAVVRRLERADFRQGRVGALLELLAERDGPGLRKLLEREAAADALDLDQELLEPLLADLALR